MRDYRDGLCRVAQTSRARSRDTLSALVTIRMRSVVPLFLLLLAPLFGQGNYEIQVYPGQVQEPGTTMLELHSNFTAEGSQTAGGVLGTNHQQHETVEITQGWNKWFETGFYIFTSIQGSDGWQWVGDHIRPRVAIPEDWKWPVGLSLSTEFGYQRALFSPDTWTLEIRPIIDKQIGRLYLDFNPTFDRSFHGPSVGDGLVFSPNVKAGWNFTKKIQGGFEYYGAVGPLNGLFTIRDQEHQIYPAIDVDFGPQWEFNFGVGVGMTQSTDHLIVKMILGRRFGKVKASSD